MTGPTCYYTALCTWFLVDSTTDITRGVTGPFLTTVASAVAAVDDRSPATCRQPSSMQLVGCSASLNTYHRRGSAYSGSLIRDLS